MLQATFMEKSTRRVYSDLHANVQALNKSKVFKDRAGNDPDPPLNVVIFGFDSLSRSNFIRNLPLTYKVRQPVRT